MNSPANALKAKYPVNLRAHRESHPWMEPIDAYRALREPNSVLLESVSGLPKTAENSLIALDPLLTFAVKNGITKITDATVVTTTAGDPFTVLKRTLEKYQVDGDMAAVTGMIGYIGYDACRYIESIPAIAADDLKLPDMLFILPRIFLWFDHLEKKIDIVIISDANAGDPVEERRRLKSALKRKLDVSSVAKTIKKTAFISNFDKLAFERAVLKAKEYIFAGDIYQVNLSQRLTAELPADPLDIYQTLRQINPSPFAAFYDFGDWQMVGCSPERLVRLRGAAVETRPIAGTIRRGRGGAEDRRFVSRLVEDIKERAEHIMLVDLERNDLGRVCDYGSVEADELMVTESYSHVTHIVSNVVGRLNNSKTPIDLIRACFPGGTITGCPKVRSMEIIEELEPVRRGPYTGSMGYIKLNGDLDLNIIIRTLIIKDGLAHVQAGAGIVADSKPAKEYRETLYKAEALIRATRQATENHE